MTARAICEHERFSTNALVHRITETEGGPVIRYSVDVRIKCEDCDKPFRFIGLPMGLSPAVPKTDLSGIELRAPIEPHPRIKTMSEWEDIALTPKAM